MKFTLYRGAELFWICSWERELPVAEKYFGFKAHRVQSSTSCGGVLWLQGASGTALYPLQANSTSEIAKQAQVAEGTIFDIILQRRIGPLWKK